MRGLIYKDISIFFKSIDKKLILIAAAAIVSAYFQCWNLCRLIYFRYVCHDNRYAKYYEFRK